MTGNMTNKRKLKKGVMTHVIHTYMDTHLLDLRSNLTDQVGS